MRFDCAALVSASPLRRRRRRQLPVLCRPRSRRRRLPRRLHRLQNSEEE